MASHKQASNAYHVEYNKRKYQRVEIVLNKETDKDLIDWLNKQINRAQFIKDVLREKLRKERK